MMALARGGGERERETGAEDNGSSNHKEEIEDQVMATV